MSIYPRDRQMMKSGDFTQISTSFDSVDFAQFEKYSEDECKRLVTTVMRKRIYHFPIVAPRVAFPEEGNNVIAPAGVHRNNPSLSSLRIVRRFSTMTRSHDDLFSIGK